MALNAMSDEAMSYLDKSSKAWKMAKNSDDPLKEYLKNLLSMMSEAELKAFEILRKAKLDAIYGAEGPKHLVDHLKTLTDKENTPMSDDKEWKILEIRDL